MIALYSLLTLMLVLALVLLAIPFVKYRIGISKYYFIVLIFMLIFSFGLYQFSGNKTALYLWLASGKNHYQLQEKFEQLGGVDGAIQSVEEKLKSNPDNAQGWLILGKLYRAKKMDAKAKEAFARAHELEPNK